MVRDEEERPVRRQVLEPGHLDAAIEEADEGADEREDRGLHAAAGSRGNLTLRNAPIASTRTTKRTTTPAR